MKSKKKKQSRSDYLAKKQRKAQLEKNLNSIKVVFDEDKKEKLYIQNMSESQKIRRTVNLEIFNEMMKRNNQEEISDYFKKIAKRATDL